MRSEFRVLLRDKCVVNPPPYPEREQALEAIPLLGLFLPKLIELGLGGVASLLKKAGAEETKQVSGAEIASLYQTDKDQKITENTSIGCLIGIYGDFGGEDTGDADERDDDWAVSALKAAGIIPPISIVRIIFEAAFVRTSDRSAFYLETRHFSVREFVGRKGSDHSYVATLTVTTPSATADGTTIAIGNIALGQVDREELPIPRDSQLGAFPRYRSNLMPWNHISQDAQNVYDSDVKRNAAAGRTYMPVTFNLTLSETADGNKFLQALGELLEGSKADAAKEIAKLIDPDERAKREKTDADAAEKLYKDEEDALIAVKEAEKNLAAGKPEDKAVLETKLAKARRAFVAAKRLREAAGLGPFELEA